MTIAEFEKEVADAKARGGAVVVLSMKEADGLLVSIEAARFPSMPEVKGEQVIWPHHHRVSA